jgi:hypothetical protein
MREPRIGSFWWQLSEVERADVAKTAELRSLTCPTFSGQHSYGYFMLRAVRSGTRCGPLEGSCNRVPSGDVGYCRSLRCI